jgi:hypothetical protein
MRSLGLTVVCATLAACGPAGEIVAPGGRTEPGSAPGAYVPLRGRAPVSKESYVPGGSPLPIYLRRAPGTYVGGADDSAADTSSVVASTGRQSVAVPGFGGDDAAWNALVGCVRDEFERWNVVVTDGEPLVGRYLEVAFGADGAELGLSAFGGVAPIDATGCGLIDRAVVFVFAARHPDARGLCEAVVQEIGHAAGLDHVTLCGDPMSPVDGCGDKSFQNVDTTCGGAEPRACICGRETQNSVAVLDDVLGAAGGGIGGPPGPACGSVDYAGSCDANGTLTWCAAGGLRTLDCAGAGLDCGYVNATVGYDCVPPVTQDPCMGLDYFGECVGDTLRYCADGTVTEIDCAASGSVCGYQDASIGYNCLLPASADGCGDVTYEGRCVGNVLEYCYQGAIETIDCGAQGLMCAYQDASIGYNCL